MVFDARFDPFRPFASFPFAPAAPAGPGEAPVAAPNAPGAAPRAVTPEAQAFARARAGHDPVQQQLMRRIQAAAPSRSELRKIEQQLKRFGFAPGPRDGISTAATRKALIAFQRAMELPADGEPTPATQRALDAVDRRVAKKKPLLVGPGQRGKGIQTLQERMAYLGYWNGPKDGVYSKDFAKAVKAFRADHKGLQDDIGVMTRGSRRALAREARKQKKARPFRARVKNTDAHQRAERRTLAASSRRHPDGTQGMGRGSKGASVAYAKRHLAAALGRYPGPIDQRFDTQMENMVKRFQRKTRGLEVNGRLDRKTWLQLRKSRMEAKDGTNPPQRYGEKSGAVKNTQKLLKRLGLYGGALDGEFGPGTRDAVVRFKKRHDVGGPRGWVGANTLKRLKAAVKRKTRGKPATGYANGVPRKIRIVQVEPGKYINATAAAGYRKMKAAAARDGVTLRINSGFRTMAEQRELYDRYGPGRAAVPGYSNHQMGVAVDFHNIGGAWSWLARNAQRFGWNGTVPGEPWHYAYRTTG